MNLASFKSFSATRVQQDPTSSTCKCTLQNTTDFTSTVPIKKIAHIKTHTNGSYLILQQVFFPRLLFNAKGIKTVLKFADLQGHIQITSSELFYCIMFYTYYYNGHHHTPMRACERIGRYRNSCARDAHPTPANFLLFSCIF